MKRESVLALPRVNREGYTPFFALVFRAPKDPEYYVRKFVALGMDINQRGPHGSTALMSGLINTIDGIPTVRALLKYGADWDIRNADGISMEDREGLDAAMAKELARFRGNHAAETLKKIEAGNKSKPAMRVFKR